MKLTVDRRPNPTRSDSPPAKDQANSPCPQRDFGTVLRELNPVHRGTVGNSSDKARRTLASSCRNCTHSWHVWWGPESLGGRGRSMVCDSPPCSAPEMVVCHQLNPRDA